MTWWNSQDQGQGQEHIQRQNSTQLDSDVTDWTIVALCASECVSQFI